MAHDRPADIVAFPRMPRPFIASLVAQCPALGAIADGLEDVSDDIRFDCECALGELFARLLYLPRLSRTEAEEALARRDAGWTTEGELALLSADRTKTPIDELWTWVWERETEPEVRSWARDAVASLARLYRLEYRFLNLRHGAA